MNSEKLGKRIIDIVVSALTLLCLSPLFFLIGMAIRFTSPGPVIFRQKRLGKNGIPFTCYKFRTMYVNSLDIRNPDGSTFNGEDDLRATATGRFLRKTSLDELPQMINVLKGDMSLVGPRPDQVDQLQYYSEQEKRKLLVTPGITGWAQINGRNALSWEERKRLDLEYVELQSLLLDLQILLRTIPYFLSRRDIFMER